jgi:hypothetical protein
MLVKLTAIPSFNCTYQGEATVQDDGTYTIFTSKFTLVPHGNLTGASLTYSITSGGNAPGGLYDRYTAPFNGQTIIVLKAKIADVVLNNPNDYTLYFNFDDNVTSNTPSVKGACGLEASGKNPYATPPYTN